MLGGEGVRVISGSARGLKLAAPEGLDTRPTTDRVKESVFNIISRYMPVGSVLDFFAGSGALGIEALSRACSRAVFVENNPAALGIIKRNTEAARVAERSEIVRGDAAAYLAGGFERFDIIFLDPPYSTGLLSRALADIHKYRRLSDGGIIVAETDFGGEEPNDENFETVKKAKYGKTLVFVLRRTGVEPDMPCN